MPIIPVSSWAYLRDSPHDLQAPPFSNLHLCSPGEKERQPRLEDPCTLERHVHVGVGVDVDMVSLLTLSPPPSFQLLVLQFFIYRTQSSSAWQGSLSLTHTQL